MSLLVNALATSLACPQKYHFLLQNLIFAEGNYIKIWWIVHNWGN